MDISKLKELINRQNDLAKEISDYAGEIAAEKGTITLEQLKESNRTLKSECFSLRAERDKLENENRELRQNLNAYMMRERAGFLYASKSKMEAYFGKSTARSASAIDEIERISKQKFDNARRALGEYIHKGSSALKQKIDSLEIEITKEIESLRLTGYNVVNDASAAHSAHLQQYHSSEINVDAVIAKEQQPKIERFIGLNMLGKIGALIIIIGIIFLAQLVNVFFSDAVRSILLFVVAGAVFLFGLFLNRKTQTVFTITVLSIGVGLLYVSLTLSYFVLGTINVQTAIAVKLAVTAVAYVVSARLRSEPIAAFAHLGGYLPIITTFGDIGLTYAAMVYFVALNMFGFVLSAKFRWQVLNYIAYGLSFVGAIIISISVAVMYSGYDFFTPHALTLVFLFVIFAMYIALPIVTNVNKKSVFNLADVILLAINTSISLVLFYVMFYVYGISDFSGLLSIIFAGVYFGLYFVTRKFFAQDTNVRIMFALVAIGLLVLFVPMQFEASWFVFAWALQGTAFILFGILKGRPISFYAGLVIAGISLLHFAVYDILLGVLVSGSDIIFVYKYASLTVCAFLVLFALAFKRDVVFGDMKRDFGFVKSIAPQLFSVGVYLNALAFFAYLTFFIFDGTAIHSNSHTNTLLRAAIINALILVFASVVPRLFRVRYVYVASIFVGVLGALWLFVFGYFNWRGNLTNAFDIQVVASVTLFVLIATACFVVYDTIKKATVLDRNLSNAVFIMPIIFVGVTLTQLFMVQYNLSFSSIVFTITYILLAAVGIFLGLYKHCVATRHFALGLTIAATLKLFVIDTLALDLVYRVVGYLVCGGALIAMSYIYQRFNSKLLSAEKTKDKNQNNIEQNSIEQNTKSQNSEDQMGEYENNQF
ncbi:MAG: DUF2339 domain-containing protein [Firmicutes bacterium]|nr:DUF2339 domain-containing protein [Bacillota bacterium]